MSRFSFLLFVGHAFAKCCESRTLLRCHGDWTNTARCKLAATLLCIAMFTGVPQSSFAQDATALANGYVGVPYSQQLSATGLGGAVTWSMTGGALPGGIVLDSTGRLAGMPVSAGDYSFTVTASQGSSSAQQALTLKVENGFGDLIAADGNNGIYRINPTTNVSSSIATLTNVLGVAADPKTGDIYAAVRLSGTIWKIDHTNGQLTQFYSGGAFSRPADVAVDQFGNVYVGDNALDAVYKLNSIGQLVDASGNPTTAAFAPMPASPTESQDVRMVFDSHGNLIVASDASVNNVLTLVVDSVNPAGVVTNLFTGAAHTLGGIDFAKEGTGALIFADYQSSSLIEISDLGNSNSMSTLITSTQLCCDRTGTGAMTGLAAQPGTGDPTYFVTINGAYPMMRVVPATGSITPVTSFSYGSALGWLRSDVTQIQAVTIAADSKSMTYGGSLPALTYTVSPSVTLDTAPTCSADFTDAAGAYTITCSGAAKSGYQITYVSGTLTVNKAVLTVTADNKSMVAGGPVPTLTASYSGFVNGDTLGSSCPPNVDVCFPAITGAPDLSTTATSTSPAGTYPITVAPGTLSATNYSFNFVNGNMSVTGAVGTAITLQLSNVVLNNGATLSGSVSIDLSQLNGNPVTFNNIVLTPGTSGLPLLTFNDYRVGFAADKPGYDPGYLSMWLPSTENSNYQLQLAIPYPFSTTTSIPLQIVPGNSNPYIGSGVFYCVGQGCTGGKAMYNVVTGWLDARATNHPQESLEFENNYFVTGDYALGSIAFQASSDGSYATGTIAIPAGTQPNAVPDGAEVLSAFLYWQTLEDAAAPSSSGAFFNGYSITGEVVSTGVQSSCFGNPGAHMRAYRASVLPYLPVRNGALQATGSHTVRLPYAGTGVQSTQGATLVVIYRVMSPGVPLRSVVVFEGAQVIDTGTTLNQTIRGFYDSVPSGNGSPVQARYNSIRSLFSSGTNWGGTAPVFPVVAYKGESINVQENWGTPGCQVWSAVVFSTNVNNTDGDGILDAWKQGPTPPGWAPPDPHQGQPGYYDVADGSWVDLAGAASGQKDIFVQFDYMVGADGHSHYPQAGVLPMVQNAFANRGVHVHLIQGNRIPEDTCTDDLTASPPQYCVYPGEPGVVDWKWGLQGLKAAPADPAACAQNPGSTSACAPRFQPGRKDSYHYMVFGHSLGIAAWTINDGTLQGIAVSGGIATITTTNRARGDGTYSCPARVTIDGVLGVPALNGVYDVIGGCTPTSFTVTTNNVADGTWVSASNASAEPLVVVIPGNTSTMSGYSDVAGADTAVTLGKWDTDALRVNVQAGTVMHELGHTLALTHGGMYTPGLYPVAEPNCKPNYQSVMNYLFQIDLLGVPDTNHPYGYVDYSNQVLNTLDENQLSTIPGLTSPLYNWTKWYSPLQPGSATAASRHCDGTPINYQVEAPYYLMQGTTGNVGWSDYQNIHFGQVTTDGRATATLHGYNDWNSIDLRQVSAAGNDYLRDGSGGIVRQGGTGGIVRQGGTGGIVRQGGSGGIVRQGGTGGIVRQGGGGGIVRQGGGGGIGADPEITHETANSYPHPPRSMTVNGASVTWTAASLGNIKQYNVYRVVNGTRTLIACVPVGSAVANCSNPQPAGQFTYTDPDWSAGASYLVTTVDISDAGVTRESTPQRNDNQTITFGPIPGKTNGDPDFELIASASSGLPVSFEARGSCTIVNGNMLHITSAGTCTVTASQPGNGDTNAATPVSQSFVIAGKTSQRITFAALPNRTLGDPAFTVSATGGGSGNPVTFTSGPATVCTSSGTNGSTITLTGVGTCTVTASQQGNANYNDAAPVQRSFAVAQYAVCGGDVGRQVLQPINSTAPYSAFKAGSTVPVKFHVCNSAGTSVGSPMKVVKAFGMVRSATSADRVVDEAIVSTTPDTAFRWDATGQQWIFNLSTKGYKAGTTYYFRIDLNDGTSISFEFKAK